MVSYKVVDKAGKPYVEVELSGEKKVRDSLVPPPTTLHVRMEPCWFCLKQAEPACCY